MGSTTTKALVMGEDGTALGSHVQPSGTDLAGAARDCLEAALGEASADGLTFTVATGYGRASVTGADRTVTEITCHGRGAHHLFPGAIIVVDVGGQDTKVITLDDAGDRVDFKMNRKCSAGTGVFLEEIARRLGVPLEDLDGVARRSNSARPLGSYCTVFASTEMLSRIRAGEPVEDLVLGAYESVVRRVTEMAELRGTVVLTGGVVTYHPIVADIMARVTGAEVRVPPNPQMVGALGAALIARDLGMGERIEEGK